MGSPRSGRFAPGPFNPRGQDVAIDVRKRREEVGGGTACTTELPKVRDGGVLVRIGLRSTPVMAALAFGFTVGLVVKYGLADAGPRRVPARLSDLETASSTSLDLQRPYGSQMPSSSGMRLASLGMPVSGFPDEDIDPHALSRRPGVFGDRPLLDEHGESFDERFGGAAVLSDTAPARREEPADAARQPWPDVREEATGQSGSSRSAQKSAAASAPAGAAKKPVRTADLSQDLSSLPPADSHTAVYDIAARTVYMPGGRRRRHRGGCSLPDADRNGSDVSAPFAQRYPNVQVKLIEAVGTDTLALLECAEIATRVGSGRLNTPQCGASTGTL
jgi:hypothetical protein